MWSSTFPAEEIFINQLKACKAIVTQKFNENFLRDAAEAFISLTYPGLEGRGTFFFLLTLPSSQGVRNFLSLCLNKGSVY